MQQRAVQSTIPFSNLQILSAGIDKMSNDFMERLRGMNEYLLVIHPDEEVYNKVIAEKQSFYDQYCQKVSVKTKPHITAMINYSQKTFCESFTAHELLLLRRAHQFHECKVVNIFLLIPGENNLFN